MPGKPYLKLTHADLSATFSYDPETGEIRWKKPASRMARPASDDLAGTVMPGTGYRVVTYKGHNIPGTHLAFMLHTGRWPKDGKVWLVSSHDNGFTASERFHRRSDLRWSNLSETGPAPAKSGSSTRARESYRRRRERQRAAEAERAVLEGSVYPNVKFNTMKHAWEVYATPQSALFQGRRLLATFSSQLKAETYAGAYLQGVRFLQTYQPPLPGEPRILQRRYAGRGPTLETCTANIAYDPNTGAFYWRNQNHFGERADYVARSRNPKRKIRFAGRIVDGASIALFLTTFEWVAPSRTTFRNGDQTDTRIDNLKIEEDTK